MKYLKKIGVVSFAKFYGLILAVFGLIAGLIIGIMSLLAPLSGEQGDIMG